MSTNYHTALINSDGITIDEVNTIASALDAAIVAASVAPNTASVALLYDSKATTTDGGGTTGQTWDTRDLNTEVDPDSIVTLSANQFTPNSGTYIIMVAAPGYSAGDSILRLYNVTQTSVTVYGANQQAVDNNNYSMKTAHLQTIFTANGTDAYRIEHYNHQIQATNGLGKAVSDGASEVYTMVLLIKV